MFLGLGGVVPSGSEVAVSWRGDSRTTQVVVLVVLGSCALSTQSYKLLQKCKKKDPLTG